MDFFFILYDNIWASTQNFEGEHEVIYFSTKFIFPTEKLDSLAMYLASKKKEKKSRGKVRLFIMKETEHNQMTSIDFDIKGVDKNFYYFLLMHSNKYA